MCQGRKFYSEKKERKREKKIERKREKQKIRKEQPSLDILMLSKSALKKLCNLT
jgi:hypothetical protein